MHRINNIAAYDSAKSFWYAISFVYARSYYVKTVTKSGHLTKGKPCSTLPNQIEVLLEDANASLSIDNILSSKLPPLSVYFFVS